MNRLPSSRAELRRRYAQPVVPNLNCAPRVCTPSACAPSVCAPSICSAPVACSLPTCAATPVGACSVTKCNCPRCVYASHPSRLETNACNMCVHAPYDCPTYRHRAYWCSHCISNFVFPEYNRHVSACNIPNYVTSCTQDLCRPNYCPPPTFCPMPICAPPCQSVPDPTCNSGSSS